MLLALLLSPFNSFALSISPLPCHLRLSHRTHRYSALRFPAPGKLGHKRGGGLLVPDLVSLMSGNMSVFYT